MNDSTMGASPKLPAEQPVDPTGNPRQAVLRIFHEMFPWFTNQGSGAKSQDFADAIAPYLRTTEPVSGCPITPESLKLHQELFDMGVEHAKTEQPDELPEGWLWIKQPISEMVGEDAEYWKLHQPTKRESGKFTLKDLERAYDAGWEDNESGFNGHDFGRYAKDNHIEDGATS